MKTKFPQYLTMFRSQRGYTQAQIAEKLKISRSTYANYESGKRSPDLEMLEQIVDVLNCSLMNCSEEPAVGMTVCTVVCLLHPQTQSAKRNIHIM